MKKKQFAVLAIAALFLAGGLRGEKIEKNEKKEPSTKSECLQILRSSTDLNLRIDAAERLEDFKDGEVVDVLIEQLNKEIQNSKKSFQLIRRIVRTLGHIGDKKALVALLRLSQYNLPEDLQDELERAIDKLQ